MFTSIFYKKVLIMSIYGSDAYFDVIVESELEKSPAWTMDKNCDATNTVVRNTGKVRVSVVPTDKFHNVFEDYEVLSVILDADVARKVIMSIKEDADDKMWYTKDRLSCAAKHNVAV